MDSVCVCLCINRYQCDVLLTFVCTYMCNDTDVAGCILPFSSL